MCWRGVCAVASSTASPYIIDDRVEDDLLYFGALLHSARHPETYRAAFEDL